jgi:hypothetical protein
MKALSLLFVLMTLYGLFTNHYGGALMSAGCAILVVYASRHYDKQDREWLRDPRHAQPPKATDDRLHEQDCECARDKL